MLVDGELVSSTYEWPKGKSKPAVTKITSWTIRADVVRKLDHAEPAGALPSADRGYANESDVPAF